MILKNVSLVLFVADNCFNIFLLVGLSVFIMYSSVTVSLIHFPPFMRLMKMEVVFYSEVKPKMISDCT